MHLLTRTSAALLLSAGAFSAQEPAAPRGGAIPWRADAERTLATARQCAEEECAWRPVLLYFTVDW